MRVRDRNGVPVVLGAELGRGGEGAVHELPGDPTAVAKVYLKAPDKAQAEKLGVMVGLASERILKLAAWPLSTLQDDRGSVVGFTMPRVSGLRPVFQVYGPKLRLRHYPKADWRFLVRVAANSARAFDAVGSAGHVIGDVNHGNLLVASDATVRLIDTDSFQVTRAGRTWTCGVGVGTHQPPEMQGLASYKEVVRTPNHDAFGLAVMIFQLLCMGRHPFMGRYHGTGEPPDIPTAIMASRYAHARDQARTRMSPGVGSLPVSVLPDEILAMFEAAFAPGGAADGRPAAATWSAALARLGGNLAECRTNPGHWFPHANRACPWCGIEAITGAPLFPVVFVAGKAGDGIALLWQEVLAVRHPPALRPLIEPDRNGMTPAPAIAIEWRGQRTRRTLTALGALSTSAAIVRFMPEHGTLMPLLAVGIAALWFWNRPKPLAALDAAERLTEAREAWKELEIDCRAYAGPQAFGRVKQELERIKTAHDGLPDDRRRRLADLMTNRRLSQLEQHLEGFDVSGMRIPGIGKGKVATLIAYGICTAADIKPERIGPIPGFGPKTIANMVAAREACGRTFHFDPGRALAPSEVTALDQDLARRRLSLEKELAAGLLRIKAVAADAERRCAELETRAADRRRELGQALADAHAAGIA